MNPNSRNRRQKSSVSYCGGSNSIYGCSILLFFLWISALLYYHWDQKFRTTEGLQPVVSMEPEDEMHVIFSTDCSFFQDWQTLLVFHSAVRVGQKGRITRIASGCEDIKQTELKSLYAKLFPQYSVHFTPDYKKDGKTKKKYDFYNKPYGVQHWLQNAQPPIKSGVVVALIDPDFIFLRPLVTQIAGHPSNLYITGFDSTKDPVPIKVGRGIPVSQKYGLGAPWAIDTHPDFDRRAACGAGSPCLNVTQSFGTDHYSVGPPYIVERDDLVRITTSWTRMVPIVYSKHPDLLSEMYAYSMAAAHEQLPHFTMYHYMVSNTFIDGEGWPWVDALGDEVCVPPSSEDGVFFPGKPLPIFLHYCQFFRAAEIGFQKRRVRKGLFECAQPMMMKLPRNLGKTTYKNRDGDILPLSREQARRNAFALCVIHDAINAMLVYYKARMCAPETINSTMSINAVVSWPY